jgi:arylsulfatase A-like enzyme
MPRTTELAAGGTVFTNVLATSTWTLPTHASLFTGLMPRFHGARAPACFLTPRCHTLAEVLGAAGYTSACITNNPWIAQTHGMHRGFDHLWDPLLLNKEGQGESGDDALVTSEAHRRRVEQLLERFPPEAGTAALPGDPAGDKNARYSTALALDWMRSERTEDATRPLFLFVNLMNAHLPYLPPQPYPVRYLGEADGKDPLKYGHKAGILEPERNKINRRRADGLRKLYRASIAYMDEIIGQVVDHLQVLGMLDDTVFVVVSDHGEHIGEHGLLGHAGPPWKTTTWVPMIVRYPRAVAAGQRDDRLASQVDLFPTILELTGLTQVVASFDYPLHGRSLLSAQPSEFLISEYHGDPAWTDTSGGQSLESSCLLTDQYRLLWRDVQGTELLRRTHGAGAEVDVSAEEPEQLAALEARLAAWKRGVPLTEGDAARIDPEARKRLEELGYLQPQDG